MWVCLKIAHPYAQVTGKRCKHAKLPFGGYPRMPHFQTHPIYGRFNMDVGIHT